MTNQHHLLEKLYQKYHEKASRDGLRAYLEQVTIDRVPEPEPFGVVGEVWQWKYIFGPLIPAIEKIMGRNPGYNGPMGFWYTLPRGHDKTSSIARIINGCLCYSKRMVRVSVAAKDRDQAALIRLAMEKERDLNPWFGNHLIIDRYRAKGPSGEVEILSADSKGSYGLSTDFYICDELTHWEREDFWTAIFSGQIKRTSVDGSYCVFVVLTNAGFKGTWQHELLLRIKGCSSRNWQPDPTWYVYEAPGMLAGWMDKKQIALNRTKMPAVEAARLYDNVWVDPSSMRVYSYELIQKMIQGDCKKPLLGLPRHPSDMIADYDKQLA